MARGITGSCLCAAVGFEIDAAHTPIELCHCPRCRKATGAAFAATFYVRAGSFRWLRGEEQIGVFDAPIRERPPAYRRVFCRLCGSSLPLLNRSAGYAEIPAGLLDQDPGVRPVRQIFTARKAAWFEPSTQLPAHPEHVAPSDHLLARLLGGS